jgi:hypothetical protein
VLVAEAVFGFDVLGRLVDLRSLEVGDRLERDALVRHVDAEEGIARAHHLDGGVAGCEEGSRHEAAGVRREQPVGQRRQPGHGHSAGERHDGGLERAGREHQPVVGSERVGVERNAVVGELRSDAAPADERREYVVDVRLGRLALADLQSQEWSLGVEHLFGESARRVLSDVPQCCGGFSSRCGWLR